MKAETIQSPERNGRTEVAFAPAAAAPKPAVAATAEPKPESHFGIPDKELTPAVRNALTVLMQDVERLRAELKQAQARVDELTRTADQDTLLPIFNRRAFVREITRAIAVAERYGTPSSVLYFDLNNFKAVNDEHGHPAGDAVLRHFSDLISSQIRDSDVLARLGGDEFGVILSHVTFEQAKKKGANLLQALRSNLPSWHGETVDLSFSYGAYELHAGETADAAIQHADHAMYKQKALRRTATP